MNGQAKSNNSKGLEKLGIDRASDKLIESLSRAGALSLGSNIASWWGNGDSTALGVERLFLRMEGSYPPSARSACWCLQAALRRTSVEVAIVWTIRGAPLLFHLGLSDRDLHILACCSISCQLCSCSFSSFVSMYLCILRFLLGLKSVPTS